MSVVIALDIGLPSDGMASPLLAPFKAGRRPVLRRVPASIRPARRTRTTLTPLARPLSRYLLNGNILAARAFLAQLISQFASTRSDFVSSLHPSPLPVGKPVNGQQDEVVLTKDPLVNFAQLTVRTCQRAQGDKNKAVREAWVRLCGTYQSKGGPLAAKEVRKVSSSSYIGGFIL